MDTYTAVLKVCEDDIEEIQIPYNATIEFWNGGRKLCSYQMNFEDLDSEKMQEIMSVLGSGVGYAEISRYDSNGLVEIIFNDEFVSIRVCHVDHDLELQFKVNEGLINAFDTISGYFLHDYDDYMEE